MYRATLLCVCVCVCVCVCMNLQKEGEEAQDKIGMKDAAMFPLYASGGLFGIYIFFKVSSCSLNRRPIPSRAADFISFSLSLSLSRTHTYTHTLVKVYTKGVCQSSSKYLLPCARSQCTGKSLQVHSSLIPPLPPLVYLINKLIYMQIIILHSALLEPYIPAFIIDRVTKYKLLLVAESPDKKKGTLCAQLWLWF